MQTDLSFINTGQQWPPVADRDRLKQYTDNQLLFEGEHPKVFNDWYKILRRDQNAALEFVFNLLKRTTTLWADLLVGEPPRFVAGDDGSAQQQTCDRIIAANDLPATIYEVAIDLSRYGDGLFKIRLEDGQAMIEGQPPSFWFPVVRASNLRKVWAHVLAWPFTIYETPQGAPRHYLRLEIHTKGRIDYRIHSLEGGAIIGQQLNGAQFDPDWIDFEDTKVADFLLVPVHGLRTTDRYFGIDDYGDIISIIQEMEVRVAQISKILDKHSDPSMWGPTDALKVNAKTGETEKVAGGEYYPVDDASGIPAGYITWDGHLDAAFKELEYLIQQFYIVSETSPAAFGQMEGGGQVTSGSALRRLMMAPLAKNNRMRLRMDPGVRKAIQIAADLERANGNGDTQALPTLTINWRDGLPEDPTEAATIESTRMNATLTSRYSAIRRLDGGSEKEIQDELDRISEDEAGAAATAAAAMPPAQLAFQGGGQS